MHTPPLLPREIPTAESKPLYRGPQIPLQGTRDPPTGEKRRPPTPFDSELRHCATGQNDPDKNAEEESQPLPARKTANLLAHLFPFRFLKNADRLRDTQEEVVFRCGYDGSEYRPYATIEKRPVAFGYGRAVSMKPPLMQTGYGRAGCPQPAAYSEVRAFDRIELRRSPPPEASPRVN